MKEMKINDIEELIYYEKLDNGLDVYLIPNNKKKTVYATYTTKYGSIHNEFVPIGKTKYNKVPEGIAHFLEHKMFEQEDGTDPFIVFGENGADANAGTGYHYTSYLFYGGDNLEANLNYLIDYVSSPYFTDINVEKEKGIIEQEIKMYDDEPSWLLQDKLRENTFFNHPIKYPIGGYVKSIRAITKDDLYTCYNTFYHPSNMVLIVTGNFNHEEVLKIIKDNFSKKEYPEAKKISIKKYKEPTGVVKEYAEKEMSVETPKFAVSIKIPLKPLKGFDPKKRNLYLGIIGYLLFGKTSLFYERMRDNNYLTLPLNIEKIDLEDYIYAVISGESDNPDKLIEELKKELKNISVKAEELERIKKVFISNNVSIFDNIVATNSKILDNIIKYQKLYYDELDIIRGLNIDELNKLAEKLDLSNISVYIIKPRNKITLNE